MKGVGQAREINRVIKAGLTEKSTFNQRLKGGGVSQPTSGGKSNPYLSYSQCKSPEEKVPGVFKKQGGRGVSYEERRR